ncbi:MAG TPA: hypothetical protein DCF63_13295, partial [Planctomycetaceae bacterium]|nr:hypothetical protein [Planctomycetaceae bacterium]
NFTGAVETQVGGADNDTLNAGQGAAAVDRLIGGLGNDTLISDGGPDVLIGGQGDDILTILDVDFSGARRLLGGNGTDTLRLDGSGLTFDLTAINDNRIVDIEQIDLTGSGNNTLTLNQREVLNLSSHSNALIVRRNLGDTVNIGSGWTQQPIEIISAAVFAVYTQGSATLKILDPTPQIVGRFVDHVGYTNAGSSIDTGKVLAKEGETSQLLGFDNLINTTRGINGLVFDIANLPGNVTSSDFTFQMSPQGAVVEGTNTPASWIPAPTPTSVTVQAGFPSRGNITWPNNTIENRWLRVTVKANANTGLATKEVYYLGHQRGETTGPSGGHFTVSIEDILQIRTALTQGATANSTVDLDKSGMVLVGDILAARSNLNQQLTQISIPAAEGGGGGSVSEGGDSQTNLHGEGGLESLVESLTPPNSLTSPITAYAAAVDSALDDLYLGSNRRRGRR